MKEMTFPCGHTAFLIPNSVHRVFLIIPLSSHKNVKPLFYFYVVFFFVTFSDSVGVESGDAPGSGNFHQLL